MKSISRVASRRIFCQFILFTALIFIFFLYSTGLTASSSSSGYIDGGPCVYHDYRGEAEIVSIDKRPEFPGEYEIKFSFHTREKIQEKFITIEGRFWTLVREDYSYPREDFLKQYGIKTGKRFPCSLRIIVRGTCSPILFKFSTLGNATNQ